jgi:hypothetical protein
MPAPITVEIRYDNEASKHRTSRPLRVNSSPGSASTTKQFCASWANRAPPCPRTAISGSPPPVTARLSMPPTRARGHRPGGTVTG